MKENFVYVRTQNVQKLMKGVKKKEGKNSGF